MTPIIITAVIGLVVAALVGIATFGLGVSYRRKVAEVEIGSAEEEAKRILNDALKTAENKKREILLEAKEETHRNRAECDRDIKERRSEIQRQEHRLQQKEESLDKKLDNLEQKEEKLAQKSKEIDVLKDKLSRQHEEQVHELERISGLTAEEAKKCLLQNVEEEVRHEMAIMVKDLETKARDEAEQNAKNIIGMAIQKYAADLVSESTVSVVQLPNDDMKGRIIGREGRNIRALETATGMDLIIDDTPEAVILSGFDPVRREVARIALEKLIADGRIHPARIEEMVERAKKEVDAIIKREGERATFDTGVHGLHPEVVKLLGRLHYRTSYGQNVLQHSIEVSAIAGMMAGELGLDVVQAKRAGLLHDLGKAVDHEIEGSHVTIGADLAKKYKENPLIINAIMAHHGDVQPESTIACLVQAADAVSAARPGARRENIESYIKRLEKLEEIANSFKGVEASFAIQAGREVRIMVRPDEINDETAVLLARDVVKRIEDEMEYPGQIKVNVIRETRATEIAK